MLPNIKSKLTETQNLILDRQEELIGKSQKPILKKMEEYVLKVCKSFL